MEEVLISVIIPIYRSERYVRVCIDSVLTQTYRNLEIILIDDGSDDDCPDICDRYAAMDHRVVVIHQKNQGISETRNRGIESAHGQYLAFVDSDDAIAPNYIEELVKACKGYDADIVICDYLVIRNDFAFLPYRVDAPTIIESNDDLLRKNSLAEIRYIVPWCKLYRRTLFEGLRYPAGRIHEDEFLTWRIFLKARVVICIEQALYYYRRWDKSIMGQGFSLARLDCLDALREKVSFFEKNGNEKEAILNQKRLRFKLRQYATEMRKQPIFKEEDASKLEQEADEIERLYGKSLCDTDAPEHVSFLFPFHLISQGTSIAIYGAGILGKDYYRQASTIGWCRNILLTDKYNIDSSPEIQSIDRLFAEKYDYLLLAIRDRNIAPQVKEMLIAMGIPVDKIVWNSPEVLTFENAIIERNKKQSL